MEYILDAWTHKLLPLDKRIKGFLHGYRQNIALLGDDPEENSYLIESYFSSGTFPECVRIHLTAAHIGRKEFYKGIIRSVLTTHCPGEHHIDTLINHCSETLPHTVATIKTAFKKHALHFTDILELITVYLDESDTRCILCIEEFHQLTHIFKNCFKAFSKFLLLQRNCMVVIACSLPKEGERILNGELNLLFGNFEKIHLSDQSFLNSYLFLRERLKSIPLPPFPLSFLIHHTGNNTLYTDYLAEQLTVHWIREGNSVDLTALFSELLYRRESFFFKKFSSHVSLIEEKHRDARLLLKLLISLSEGYMRKKELAESVFCDTREIRHKLAKLTDLNFVQKLGNIYKIKDPLFSFWLKHVYRTYYDPPTTDPFQRKRIWKLKIEETINIFKEEFYKNTLQKILDLVLSFQDDKLKAHSKKYSLPSIQRNTLLSYPHQNLSILIGEGKEVVFAGIVERDIADPDMFDFLERGKNIKGKKVRKIFIALGRIPATSKLIAKKNKLHAWDIDDLNNLLRIYNKPIISFTPSPAETVAEPPFPAEGQEAYPGKHTGAEMPQMSNQSNSRFLSPPDADV
ncbi:MAG: hypothetical protein GF333_08080 [Candidatus Omnitrophica bacterium]|nr:hypothetical protein [Candidatus Omnitrophota bacterium]